MLCVNYYRNRDDSRNKDGRDKDRERDHHMRRDRRGARDQGSQRSQTRSDWDNETPSTDKRHREGETPYSRMRGMQHRNEVGIEFVYIDPVWSLWLFDLIVYFHELLSKIH